MTKIRAFDLEDEGQVIELWNNCDLVTPNNIPTLDIERKLKVNPDLFLVAVSEDKPETKIVGSVMGGYEGHRGWINYLAVDPNHRRKGIARKLMKEIEEKLITKGAPKINLQIRKTNQEVMAFYEAIGYIEDKVISMGKRLEENVSNDCC